MYTLKVYITIAYIKMSSHLLIHLQTIEDKNIIRILSFDKKATYLEEFNAIYPNDIYYQPDKLCFHCDDGKWLARLKNDLEFKKFKEFTLVKKNDLYEMVLKKQYLHSPSNDLNLGLNEKYLELYKSVFLNFVNNKINSYNEEENEEEEEEDEDEESNNFNSPTESNNFKPPTVDELFRMEGKERNNILMNFNNYKSYPQHTSKKAKGNDIFLNNLIQLFGTEGHIKYNDYIDTYYESKEMYQNFIKENEFKYKPDIYVKINKFKFKCLEKIDDEFYYLSKKDLFALFISYFQNSTYHEYTDMKFKEPTNLKIKGKINYKLSINQDYIDIEDIPYVLNYFKLISIPNNQTSIKIEKSFYEIRSIINSHYSNLQNLEIQNKIFNQPIKKNDDNVILEIDKEWGGRSSYPESFLYNASGESSISIDGMPGNKKKLGYAPFNVEYVSPSAIYDTKKKDDLKTIYFYKNTLTNHHFIINFNIKYFTEVKLIYQMVDNDDSELLKSLVNSISIYDKINIKTINKIKTQIDTFLEMLNLIIEDESKSGSGGENIINDKNSKQKYYTSQYVSEFKDDNSETLATQVSSNVSEYLSHFVKDQNININQIGKDLVSLNVKKNRKSAGYFYGIKNPNQEEILKLVNKNKISSLKSIVNLEEKDIELIFTERSILNDTI